MPVDVVLVKALFSFSGAFLLVLTWPRGQTGSLKPVL